MLVLAITIGALIGIALSYLVSRVLAYSHRKSIHNFVEEVNGFEDYQDFKASEMMLSSRRAAQDEGIAAAISHCRKEFNIVRR